MTPSIDTDCECSSLLDTLNTERSIWVEVRGHGDRERLISAISARGLEDVVFAEPILALNPDTLEVVQLLRVTRIE